LSPHSLLDRIASPRELRALPEADLPQLCDELRQNLLEVVSGVGGHLSSSLGVVELTVALHYTLDTPRDMVVWDVGHQAYIHKILTGRREEMRTIRKYGGISGFLKRSESPHDVYGAGHASTAISAAYGLAVGRDLKGEKSRVAAVLGDGSLTGGLCYEAFNNVGNSKHQFLVVLNDNQMSISPNVGAVHSYLANFATTPLYQSFRKRVKEGLERVPRYGKSMSFLARRLEEGAKGVLTPGALFEALGFNYFGPVDGHDVLDLVHLLKNLRDLDSPAFLHALTVKGKGYAPAESEPENYHGVRTFCLEDGIVATPPGEPSFQEVFGQVLTRLACEDPAVVAVTAAMCTGTGLGPFVEAHPGRFFDVGIAEEHAVIFACGLAVQGLKPVCAIYSTFLQRSYDQVLHDAAIQGLPVIFCMDRAGLSGEDGPTHHGAFDLSYLRHIPGIVVAAPRDGNELRDLLATALSHAGGPFAIRYPKASAAPFDPAAPARILPLGSWEVAAPGEEVLVLAVGPMVGIALSARKLVEAEGLKPEVVNCRFVKPLDETWLRANWGRFREVVTVAENALAGGFGSAILEWLETEGIQIPVTRMGLPDTFITHGSRSELLAEVGLTEQSLAQRILASKNRQPGGRRRPRVVQKG
jgi:1-deoxy-D-xylulose-5-phosphate synthase